MNTIKTLERKHYNVDAKAIGAIAREAFRAQGTADALPGIYFRVMLANTQAALLGEPRLRAVKDAGKLNEETIAEHAKALKEAAAPLYEEILAAAKAEYPGRGNGELRHSKTAFARSAKSTLMGWVKAGYDITSLVAAKATKRSFKVERESVEAKPETIQKRAEVSADRIIESVRAITDPEMRRKALEAALSKLEAELAPLMGGATKDPKEAQETHRPLKIPGAGTFRPAIVNGFRLAS